MLLITKSAGNFFFLFFLHGIPFGTRQQGISYNVLPLAVSGGLEKTDFRLTTKFNKMQETNNLPQNPPLQQTAVSGSLPADDRILIEAIQAARKVDTEVGLLPSYNDIKMFCLGAKWMRDWIQGNDR